MISTGARSQAAPWACAAGRAPWSQGCSKESERCGLELFPEPLPRSRAQHSRAGTRAKGIPGAEGRYDTESLP